MSNKLNVGDDVMYCPPYVRFHSGKYEGKVLNISADQKTVRCKLGFGVKDCRAEDIVKIKPLPQPPTTNN